MSCVKMAYVSRREAQRAMKRDRGRGMGPKRAYYCLECGLWHLTSLLRRQVR